MQIFNFNNIFLSISQEEANVLRTALATYLSTNVEKGYGPYPPGAEKELNAGERKYVQETGKVAARIIEAIEYELTRRWHEKENSSK